MIWRSSAILVAALAASACADVPRDVEGTLDRVRADRSFRVGVIAPGSDANGAQRRFVAGVAAATGARAVPELGAAEALLAKLEHGDLDLVVGELSPESPWSKQVTLLPPLVEGGDGPTSTALIAAARNGENGWIRLLHRQRRAVAGAGG